MDAYATHLEALAEALASSEGPVLELGCGDYSTPLIAAVTRQQARRFLVQAADAAWCARFSDMAEVQRVDWARWVPPPPPDADRWGLVLLDSEESTAGRLRRLPALHGLAQRVVLHDADAAMTRAHWAECTAAYAVTLYRRYLPWTALLLPC